MTKKLSLSLAIASGLGLFTQHAMAADQVIDLHAGGTQDPAVFAAELAANQPTLTLASGEAFQVRVPVPTYIIDTNNPFFIKFALVGGSKFDNLAAATTALNCALASPDLALADAITKAIASALAAQTATSADVMGTNATGSAAGTVGKLLYDAVVAEDAVSNYATDDTVRQLAVSSAAALKAKTAAILAAVTTADTDAAAVDTADAADDTTVSPTVVKGVTDANVATLTTAAAAAKTAAKTLDDAAEDLVTAINDTIIIAEAAAAAAAVTGADAASVAAAITTALLPTATAATVTAANAAAGGAGNTTAVDAIADVNTYLNGTTAGTAETAAIALDTAGSNANLAAMTTKTIATKDAADVLKAFTDTKAAGTRVVGSDGDQSLTYQLVEPAAGQTKLNSTDVSTDTDVNGKGCLFTFNAVKGMSGNMVNQTLSAVVQYKDGNSLIDVPYSAPIITFAQAAVVSYDKGSNKVIVDVSKSSKLFTTAASNGGEATTVGEKTASLGTVTYKAVSPKPRAADGADYNPVNAITNAILTIKGPALGAVAAATVTGDVNEGAVYLTTTAANCNTGAGANIIDSAKQVGASGTVSFELSNAEAVAGVDVCMLVDGEHDIAKGQITAELTATPNGTARPVLSLDNNNLVEVTKNGKSVKVLNIPSPSGVDKPYIRINNMGNQSGKVFGTLYNAADGTVIGTANAELGNVTPYQTIVINDAGLKTIFGVDAWAGRAWMQIDAELSDLAVQGLIRTPAGVLSNLSKGGDEAN